MSMSSPFLLSSSSLLWSDASGGLVRFVSTTGSDANAGDSLAAPWRNLQYAWDNVTAGTTIFVRGGTYNEGLGAAGVGGTSWTNAVTFTAYPGDPPVWIKPSTLGVTYASLGFCIIVDWTMGYVIFNGINTDGTLLNAAPNIAISTNNGNNPHHFRIQNSEHIAGTIGGSGCIVLGGHSDPPIGATGSNQVLNCTIHGGGIPPPLALNGYTHSSYGVYCSGPSNLVDGNNIYDVSGYGIQVYNAGSDPADNNIVRNNRIHDITRSGDLDQCGGIIIGGSTNYFYNNRIYNISVGNTNANNAGIYIYYGNANKIWNNTIYNVKNSGIRLGDFALPTNTDTRNNVVYLQTGTAYSNGAGVTNTQSGNMFIGTNPLFVNQGAGDFHITNTCPGYHAGVYLSGANNTDAAGSPFNNPPSIGAFEVVDSVGIWTRIGGAVTGSVDATGATTVPFDTTGADLIVLNVGRYTGISATVTVSDAYSNTWVAATDRINANTIADQMYYCLNPTVGAGHTFTAVGGDLIFPVLCVEAWTGAGVTPFSGQNGATSVGASTIQTGTLAGATNAIWFAGLGFDDNSDGAVTIDQSFVAAVQPLIVGYSIGGALAYLVGTAAASKNPTWSVTTAPPDGLAASILVFASDRPSPMVFYYRMAYSR